MHIEADNVTIENCKIASSSFWVVYVHQGVTGTVIQDSNLDGLGKAGKGILGQGTFLRNDISNVVDGIDVSGSNTRIEGNYIHDLYGTDGPHYDGINIDASNVIVKHNTVINDHGQTSALMVSSDWGTDRNVLVEDNLLVGGGYTIYAVTGDAGPGTLVDVRFVNNHFGSGEYGTTNINTNITMTGNVNDGAKLAAELSEGGPYTPPAPVPPTTPTTPTPPTPPAAGPTEAADTLTGDSRANTIDARGGNDRVDGGAGNDILKGGSGNDTLIGGVGNDTLNGGTGKDVLTGGAGNDVFVFQTVGEMGTSSRDVITDFTSGQDKIDLSTIDANARSTAADVFSFVPANGAAFTNKAGELTWATDSANNRTIVQGDINGDGVRDFAIELTGIKTLTASDFIGVAPPVTQPPPAPPSVPGATKLGTSRYDRLEGGNGNDILDGLGGNDRLLGGNGNDTLIGGSGKDVMTGGAGRDVFQFKTVSEMGTYASARDVITDFTKGQDKIDLSSIDANSRVSGNQAFTFLAGDDDIFTKKPGEVAWHTEGGKTVIQGDTNGDGVHDFEIQLTGKIALTAGDFVL